jgi:hypothetical protein
MRDSAAVDLEASGTNHRGARGLTMHVNKVSRVRTIDRVAKELGEDVDFLFDVAIEMEPEDVVILVGSTTRASWRRKPRRVDQDPSGPGAAQRALIGDHPPPCGPRWTVTPRRTRSIRPFYQRMGDHKQCG